MARKKQVSSTSIKLTIAQLSKLQSLTNPDRWVDESFDRTKIGAFLLEAQLIAPNPDPDAKKAFIVTSEGLKAIRAAK